MVQTPKTHALTIRFSASDAALLTALAAQRDVPAAQIIREALRAYAASLPNPPRLTANIKRGGG
jgi:hypothetical protein